jgi:hypothetical protein
MIFLESSQILPLPKPHLVLFGSKIHPITPNTGREHKKGIVGFLLGVGVAGPG